MKYLPVAFLLVMFCGCRHTKVPVAIGTEFTGKKHFGVKSCKLMYKFFDGIRQGERTVIFDEWGNVGRVYTVTRNDTAILSGMFNKMPPGKDNPFLKEYRSRLTNQTGDIQELVIKNEKETITINLDTREGVRQSNASLPLIESYADKEKKVIGQEKVLGLLCDVVLIGTSEKVWLWNNIVLRKQQQLNKTDLKVEEYVTDVDADYVIRTGEFNVPDGMTIR